MYKNDIENRVFSELKNVNGLYNYKSDKDGNVLKYQSGLYNYLIGNMKKYKIPNNECLQKSKLDFLLDNLYEITEVDEKNDIMTKYLYYVRLLKKLFIENPEGKAEVIIGKYKNDIKDKNMILMILLKMNSKNFSYIMENEDNKFKEIDPKELITKIGDKDNPIIIYNRPYKIKTGPVNEDKKNSIINELEK